MNNRPSLDILDVDFNNSGIDKRLKIMDGSKNPYFGRNTEINKKSIICLLSTLI